MIHTRMRSHYLLFLTVAGLVARASLAIIEDDEQLIGWKGETYNAGQAVTASPGPAGKDPWVETLSWRPRTFLYHGFLSHEECDHLIKIATPLLERSQVVGEKGDEIDPVRTSYSASIGYAYDKVVSEIEERVARWTHLPRENQEPLEVLRYVNGQKYDAHWDWFDDHEIKDGTGNRMATVLMYLSDVEPAAGGETALPLAYPLDLELQSLEGRGFSECAAQMGLSVRPRKGDVLLFWDMDLDGTPDRHALHASCPTTNGTKWTATKWIHNVVLWKAARRNARGRRSGA